MGFLSRVSLHLTGHETLGQELERITPPRPIKGIVFNLGYLPMGEHALTTKPTSTLSALAQGLSVLAPGGLLTVAVYPGHPVGAEEAGAVEHWAVNLDPDQVEIATFRPLKTRRPSPWLLIVAKR